MYGGGRLEQRGEGVDEPAAAASVCIRSSHIAFRRITRSNIEAVMITAPLSLPPCPDLPAKAIPTKISSTQHLREISHRRENSTP